MELKTLKFSSPIPPSVNKYLDKYIEKRGRGYSQLGFNKSKETGINSKYIGQIAKADEEITASSGVISIYGERWEARSENGSVIEKGSEVKIIRNESIIMYVEK